MKKSHFPKVPRYLLAILPPAFKNGRQNVLTKTLFIFCYFFVHIFISPWAA
jgi:hypothetical protein